MKVLTNTRMPISNAGLGLTCSARLALDHRSAMLPKKLSTPLRISRGTKVW